MLLTITTTHKPATDLGFLLHKHPDRFQSIDLSIGILSKSDFWGKFKTDWVYLNHF